MDNVTVLPPPPGSKRAKITEPVFDKDAIDKILRRMDALISVLREVGSALELHFINESIVDDETVSASQCLQKQLREAHIELCAHL